MILKDNIIMKWLVNLLQSFYKTLAKNWSLEIG